ncbi:MAG: N-acetylmuramoyl-L-alanine amidase [Verrucomicrobiota bacterium]
MRATRLLILFLLLQVFSTVALAGYSTVVIDAGHGGHDPGGIPGQRVQEKAVALDVARRLRFCLQEAGLRSVLTRSDDTFIPLPQRVAIANAQRNAVFVSIHFNSSTRAGAHGYETYYYRPSAAALAVRIQSLIARLQFDDNRHVKRRGYFVLRRTTIPAVLVECGFLTNPDEARLALRSDYREKLARTIGRAVIELSGH